MENQSGGSGVVAMVHAANAKAHDFYAKMHDRNVPYIHRRSTREYYWRLLEDACNNNGQDFKDSSVLEGWNRNLHGQSIAKWCLLLRQI